MARARGAAESRSPSPRAARSTFRLPNTEDSFAVATWAPVDLSEALVVLGFPSVGLVGSIATSYLSGSLRLREAGAVLSPAFPPTAVVRNGVSASPIRIYLGEVACGVDGSCEQLCLVHSDVTPKSNLVGPLALSVAAWAKEHRARQLICLEGLKVDVRASGPAQVWGVASDEAGRDLLAKMGIPFLADGLLTGIGGVVLYAARALDLPAVCLMAETREDFPDARGAARLLALLQPLVPLLPIDERPLYAQAEALEIAFREQAEHSRKAAGELSRRADMMFG